MERSVGVLPLLEDRREGRAGAQIGVPCGVARARAHAPRATARGPAHQGACAGGGGGRGGAPAPDRLILSSWEREGAEPAVGPAPSSGAQEDGAGVPPRRALLPDPVAKGARSEFNRAGFVRLCGVWPSARSELLGDG